MTFTFVPTNDIGKVRRLTGEKVEAESETSDEEIQSWLDDNGNNHEVVAIKILRSLAATWSKRSTIATGNERMNLSDVAKNYLAMAADLEKSLGTQRVLFNKGVNRVRDSDRTRPN